MRSATLYASLISVAVLVACATEAEPPSTSDGPIVVQGVRVIDGTGVDPVEGRTVVIDEGRISAVGTSGDPIPEGARVIDGTGLTAMPGLADMHVHLVGGWDGVEVDMLGYRRYMNSLVYSGVTTVMDVGNVLPYVHQLRQAIEAGRIPGPRIYMAGALVEGSAPVWPPISFSVAGDHDVRRVVDQLVASDVDILKGYVGLSATQVDSLISIGEEYGLKTVVDLGRRGTAWDSAVVSGVAASAHVPPSPLSDATLDEMVTQGITVIGTLAVFESFHGRRFEDRSFLDDPLIANTTPPWFLEELRTFEPYGVREGGEGFRERFDASLEKLRRVREKGITVLVGTDAPYPGVFQGEGVHRELELLVEDVGYAPLAAIRAATYDPARFLGAEDEWGRIAEGLVANIVLVEGNPAEQIADTRRIRYVIQNGRVLDREALAFDARADPGFRTGAAVN